MDKNTARMFFRSTHLFHDLDAKVVVEKPAPKHKVRIEPRFPSETDMVAHFAAEPGEIEPGLELFGPTGPRCPCPIDADAINDPEMDIPQRPTGRETIAQGRRSRCSRGNALGHRSRKRTKPGRGGIVGPGVRYRRQ